MRTLYRLRWNTKKYFGVTFEQGRQELEIDDAMLSNIVTENKRAYRGSKNVI